MFLYHCLSVGRKSLLAFPMPLPDAGSGATAPIPETEPIPKNQLTSIYETEVSPLPQRGARRFQCGCKQFSIVAGNQQDPPQTGRHYANLPDLRISQGSSPAPHQRTT